MTHEPTPDDHPADKLAGDAQRIDGYAAAVERLLACPPAQAAQRRRELTEHLHDAAQAGDLAQALASLGDPQQAAEAFARERAAPPATFSRRAAAALIDNLPLVAVAIGLALQALRGTGFTLAFPPHFYVEAGGACAAFSFGGCTHYPQGVLYAVGMPVALLWSIAGLGLLEGRTGSTPGKRLLGMRVVSERGLRIGAKPGLLRRLSFLVGPLAWLDWAPFLTGRPRRLLDYVAGTKVVRDTHRAEVHA